MKRLKRILRIIFFSFLLLLTGLLITAHIFLSPMSDAKITSALQNKFTEPQVLQKALDETPYRLVSTQQQIDPSKLTLLFVHGSPGSSMDFKAYLKDSLLNKNYNLLTYDRPGYGPFQEGKILGSIEKELAILNDILKDLKVDRTALIGYSYGGPIVLAAPQKFHYKFVLAASVSASLEPQFWASKFCEWTLTRWMVPKKIRAAADEKLSHMTDLTKYAIQWNRSESPVLSIHGDKDWIVPYANSLELQKLFAPEKFKLITLVGGGHDLIWTNFEQIKHQLLNIQLN